MADTKANDAIAPAGDNLDRYPSADGPSSDNGMEKIIQKARAATEKERKTLDKESVSERLLYFGAHGDEWELATEGKGIGMVMVVLTVAVVVVVREGV